jgi:hypothetical protein
MLCIGLLQKGKTLVALQLRPHDCSLTLVGCSAHKSHDTSQDNTQLLKPPDVAGGGGGGGGDGGGSGSSQSQSQSFARVTEARSPVQRTICIEEWWCLQDGVYMRLCE